nr:MAG TPA: hypothetical protein [Caudoviricetes sp.]
MSKNALPSSLRTLKASSKTSAHSGTKPVPKLCDAWCAQSSNAQ